MNRIPLLNYGDKNIENIGTVGFLDKFDYTPSKNSIGHWRNTHPDIEVSLVYGVVFSYYPNERSFSLGHGELLQIKSPSLTRWYKHIAGNVDVDRLAMPMQAILDWDEAVRPMPRQVHWRDLKWFEPSYSSYPRIENFTREELGEEIKRRLIHELGRWLTQDRKRQGVIAPG